jgi:hypothetical protein
MLRHLKQIIHEKQLLDDEMKNIISFIKEMSGIN